MSLRCSTEFFSTHMAGFATIYALLWTVLLICAPIACAYGLIKTSTPITRGRSLGVAALGFLLSALLAFSLATTVLQPLAVLVLPALLVFSYAIFRPSVFSQRGDSCLPGLLYGGFGTALDLDVLVHVHAGLILIDLPISGNHAKRSLLRPRKR